MSASLPSYLAFYRPSRYLSPYVAAYWNMRSPVARGGASFVCRALPDARSNIVFNLSGSAFIPSEGSTAPIAAGTAVFSGLVDWHACYDMQHGMDLFGIQFRQEYWRGLLRCDLHDLKGGNVALSEFFGAAAAEELTERLLAEPRNAGRISIIETALAHRCMRLCAPNRSLLATLGALESGMGARCVAAARHDAMVSERQMERLYRQYIGLSPKRFAEVARFSRASAMLRQGVGALDIVDALGFSDQAHFSRTFRRYSGISPGAYAKESGVGFVQDADPATG